jgi:hypothetical protein
VLNRASVQHRCSIVYNNPAWTQGGQALRGYWENAVAIPAEGRPAITFEWWRDFLNQLLAANAETWFGWLIILGEIGVDEPNHVHSLCLSWGRHGVRGATTRSGS